MTLILVLISLVVALIFGLMPITRTRLPVLLGLSILAIFAFQPALPVRYLDFWLPTTSITIAVASWAFTLESKKNWARDDWLTVAIIVGMILVLGLNRYLQNSLPFTASRPPNILQITSAIFLSSIVVITVYLVTKKNGKWPIIAIGLILLIFLILKIPVLSYWVSFFLHKLTDQYSGAVSADDVRWLGFSYIAFRLIHTIRDYQAGRLPQVTLAEYVVYIIFFPTLTAGPIDRIERFILDLRQPFRLSSDDLVEAGRRLALGLFKKFVVADALALIALNGINAWQVRTAGWAWILLYAYTFQIFFDFCGYTDIAIGMGRLLGFKLPENFNQPYLKPNLTQFWNNWHMTLTQWFRAYYFNPLTRALRSWNRALPVPLVILIAQTTTMVLIGLWHGINGNFILWGLWHGLGLFIHNRWSEWTRPHFAKLSFPWQRVIQGGGIFLTFHYVALGWAFFSLPNPSSSWHILLKLFGFV